MEWLSEENIKDENEIVLTPMISGMKVVSDINEYDEVGLTIDITGENLSMLNKDNFDQYSKIYFNNKTNTFLEVSNSTSNSYINLYIDDTGKQLTLEYGVGYFTKKSINDDITVLAYEIIGNNGEIIQFYPKS